MQNIKTITIIIAVCLISSLISCKESKHSKEQKSELAILLEEYQKNTNDSTFQILMKAYGTAINAQADHSIKEKLIEEAIDICNKADKPEYEKVFGIELVKLNPKSPTSKAILENLISDMKSNGKDTLTLILQYGYTKLFPSDSISSIWLKNLPQEFTDLPAFIESKSKLIFNDKNASQLDESKARYYVDLCESYALTSPDDSIAVTLLLKAATISKAIGSYPKTIALYDWISTYYPNDAQAPIALFLKAFTIENEINKPDDAKKVYEQFLTSYPNHSLVEDVKLSIQNLGKSNSDILQNKSNVTK